jgi:adenosylcobinamide kinase/adenosylcobinamide-phosphate guanylyltransferase
MNERSYDRRRSRGVSGGGPSETILIIGGARSGKSSYAEKLARERARGDVLFVATAEASDDEMRERIARHRAARPSSWKTLEAPRNLVNVLRQWPDLPRLILLDCLTLWVSNELLAEPEDLERRLLCELDLLTDWAHLRAVDLILVSNEVGMGIVPENALARRYRDVLGIVNARAAHAADKVYWMVAGLPLEIKAAAERS